MELEDGRKADYDTHCTVGVVISFLPKRKFEESHCILKAMGLVGLGDDRYWKPDRRSR